MSAELWTHSAGELARMIAGREVTSREVVDAHLARIEAVNGRINAVTRVLTDQARAGADAADAAVAARQPLGPLHGVPFTIKENIDIVGSPTTNGVAAFAEAMPSQDSPTVQRMKEAGAVPLARTNLPDFGLRIHTHSSLHGRTVNPWHATRTAGGSSGGEAAALATGMSPIGLGNDIGGSLRNPAHCCGVASIKPTVGAVAAYAEGPDEANMISSQVMLVEGVMARRVADVRLGFQVVAKPHPRDPRSVPAAFTDLGDGERLRVAVLAEPPGGSTHPDVAAAVRRAGDVLADAGHDVVEACPPDYERAIEQWATLLTYDLQFQRPLLDLVMGDEGRLFLDLAGGVIPTITAEQHAVLQGLRVGLARRWNEWFLDHPVVLTPVWTQPAFEMDADIADAAGAAATFELMRPVLAGNLLGLPSAITPCGMADGLPVGLQVMGAPWTDLRCLAVAEQVEAGMPQITPIDPRH